MMVAFRSAHDAVTAYLTHGDGMPSAGTSDIATIHLLTRGLVDTAVAQRIALERHPIQAYSVLRAAWEAARLIDLFAAEPDLADAWADGKHAMFSPKKVGARLGHDSDPFYAYMCARSHPRFVGLQMSVFAKQGAPEGQAIHFTEIPFEVPDSFMAVAAPGLVLAKLAVLAGHIRFNSKTHRRRNLAPMMRATGADLATGWSQMDRVLTDEDRSDPSVHDLADRAAWHRDLLTTLADDIDRAFV
jgi:hypothetical protein